MKTKALFYFIDSPQFRSIESRAWAANYFRALRNRANGNKFNYLVKRVGFGRYTIQLKYTGSPVATIITNGAEQ
ncbi:MAG: hypothetical protein EBT04_11170 [Betaproteobacteria bacterium]|nr:hypothetical protein [Betaproteobacteria bacterium]